MYEILHVLLSLSLMLSEVQCDPATIRSTTNGPVEGIEQISSLLQRYIAFRSIPYAEAPITGKDPYSGKYVDRRFKAPEPLRRNWTENLKVHEFRDSCLISTKFFAQKAKRSEDCLNLNIYVPVDGAEKKTVLVWIHGGGFTEGDATDSVYGPDFLLSADNFVVTIHYRLGIFGFLNLGFDEYSGNMGLKDQQLALKWVYENIENFSGNKEEILLFGESAGGASVTYHMLNEESRKYFKRAFSMSGTIFSYFALTECNHLNRMQECSKTKDRQSLIEYLKSSASDTLVRCHFTENWGKTLKPEWTPTVEIPSASNAFIIQHPEGIYDSGKAPVMDALFSFTSQEQIAFDSELITRTEPLIPPNGNQSMIKLPYDNFNEGNHPKEFKIVLQKLKMVYFSNSTDEDAIRRANIGLMSDLNFADSVLKTVVLQTKASNRNTSQTKNTFLFRFGINDELNLFKIAHNLKHAGATHAEDLCYIFHCHILDKYGVYERHLMDGESVPYKSIKRMVNIITNFARTGNPSIEGDTPFKSCSSQNDIFGQEINNNPISSVTNNISEELHYSTWREIEQIYEKLRLMQ